MGVCWIHQLTARCREQVLIIICFVLCHVAHSLVCYRFTAVGLTPEPADQAMFWCQYKQPDSEGNTGQEMSVAHYFAKLKQPLVFPQLPGELPAVPALFFPFCVGLPMDAAGWLDAVGKHTASNQRTPWQLASAPNDGQMQLHRLHQNKG